MECDALVRALKNCDFLYAHLLTNKSLNPYNGKRFSLSTAAGTAALTGGRTGGHFGRTPARAFGSRRIGQRPGTSASASFGRDPGRWRDPIAHQLKETPD